MGKVRLLMLLVTFIRSKKECGRDRTTGCTTLARYEGIGVGKTVQGFIQSCSEIDTESNIVIELSSKGLTGTGRRYVVLWWIALVYIDSIFRGDREVDERFRK